MGGSRMFEVTELQLAGLDDRNITRIHEYEEYLKKSLPSSEVVRDMYINVDYEILLSDAYFFTTGLMIEIPDFVTYYQSKFHLKQMDFTIHPIRNAITYLTMKIAEAKGSDPRSVEINFGLKAGDTFSFSAMKENSVKLESIAQTFLMPNLDNR